MRSDKPPTVAFLQAQQARVDEHADELIADRLMQQRGDTDESTPPERPSSTRSRPTFARISAMCSATMFFAVQTDATADVDHEAAKDREAVLRVRDLGMELQRVALQRTL